MMLNLRLGIIPLRSVHLERRGPSCAGTGPRANRLPCPSVDYQSGVDVDRY
jgi:hypothetical protein